jgi:hypothetical protein
MDDTKWPNSRPNMPNMARIAQILCQNVTDYSGNGYGNFWPHDREMHVPLASVTPAMIYS